MLYNLQISELQAEIIVRALDTYSRIYLGQFDTAILDRFLFSPNVSGPQMDAARRLLDETKKVITGHDSNASFGIHSTEVPDSARIAYDVQQVIRHQIWKDTSPDNRWSICSHPPHQTSTDGIKLAKIEKVE
jgi:hypothetical protein